MTKRSAGVRENDEYEITQLQKKMIIARLKEQGCRITRQRLMLLDIILSGDCSCCKEIYYQASKKDAKLGSATVYRMINTLEEIGAISRKNMYKVSCDDTCERAQTCKVEFEDDTVLELSAGKWKQIIEAGLSACGYGRPKKIRSVSAGPCAGSRSLMR